MTLCSGNAPGPSTAFEAIERDCGKLGFRELDQQMRLQRAKRQALIERIVMGLYGPVIIMLLYPSQNANLITVSVATIIFALKFGNQGFG